VQWISGTDPTVTNTATSPNNVAIQASTATNPVAVPAYSVVRVDLNSPTVVSPVNNASYAGGVVAPQEIVSLFGSGIASQTATATLPLPTSLGSTSIRITDSTGNSQLAPLFAVSPGQANILIPSGLAAGAAKVTVAGPAASLTGSITIANSAPGLYSMNQDGANVAAAVALRYSASNQATNETVFTCAAQAARSCLPVPLSLGAATDTLYVEPTAPEFAAPVRCNASWGDRTFRCCMPVQPAVTQGWTRSTFRYLGVWRGRERCGSIWLRTVRTPMWLAWRFSESGDSTS